MVRGMWYAALRQAFAEAAACKASAKPPLKLRLAKPSPITVSVYCLF